MYGLICFYVDFVFGNVEVIQVQDCDVVYLLDSDWVEVCCLQCVYIELWMDVFVVFDEIFVDDRDVLWFWVQVCFGLINLILYSICVIVW